MRHYIKRLLICIAILTANTAAWAESYVITYTSGSTTYFLANNSGSIAAATEFNPSTCIWTSETSSSGVKLSNTYSYNNYDYKKYYLYFSSYYGNSLSLSTSNSTSWTINNNKIYYYTSGWNWGTYYYYYIAYSNNAWTYEQQYTTSSSTIPSATNPGSIYNVTTTEVGANPTTATITQTASRFTYQGDETDFNLSSFSYTPAYTYYTVGDNNNTKYYCTTDGTYVGNTPPR